MGVVAKAGMGRKKDQTVHGSLRQGRYGKKKGLNRPWEWSPRPVREEKRIKPSMGVVAKAGMRRKKDETVHGRGRQGRYGKKKGSNRPWEWSPRPVWEEKKIKPSMGVFAKAGMGRKKG
ncbi:hypothetical protein [Bacillus alkalisoli]|uniref:hypothetical protein n=1 Tax=Bacillus alkalisoli TaxID=2011008 RepID=UPI0018E22836|nr:hypothetical protein [Bacillus alkalisoli]